MPNDDEEFLIIFNNNNLEDVFQNEQLSIEPEQEDKEVELTIKDLQEGLADLCNLSAFVSSFLMDFFVAFEDGDIDSAPKMKIQMITELLDLFEQAACVIDLIDVESNDEDE